MDPDIQVDITYRDAVMKKLKLFPENQFCFDCNLKNPEWCSIILGIFICYNCATPHRNMGTHLSFVRSTTLDMWTLRQLAYLEIGGNKKAKVFFRSHGVNGNVDYTSQVADRWRNELLETVLDIYPKKSASESVSTSIEKPTEPKIEKNIEEVAEETEKKTEEDLQKTNPIKPVQAIVPRNTFKVQNTEVKHKFKKSKAEEVQAVSFKPVTFKAQTEEEEFFDPQPLKPPPKAKIEIMPTPAPAPVQRKPVEKKAISSDDYQDRLIDEYTAKARIKQLNNANAISSDMFFGREESQHSEINADRLKEEVSKFGVIAADKAKQVICK